MDESTDNAHTPIVGLTTSVGSDDGESDEVAFMTEVARKRRSRRLCTPDRAFAAGLCGCAAFVFVVMVALFTPWPLDNSDATTGEVGSGDAYWSAHAERLRNYSDPRATPCDDFYQHVCGGWLADNALAPGESSVGQFDAIADRIDVELLDVAEQGWPFVGTWYTACADVQSRAAHGTEALMPLFEAAANVASEQQLAATLATLHAAGVDALFAMGVAPDERAPTRPAVQLGYPMMGAPRSVWQGNDTLAAAQRDALRAVVGTLLGSDALATEALAFERDWLAPAQLTPAERRGRATAWLSTGNDNNNGGGAPSLPTRTFDWATYWQRTLGADPLEIGTLDPAYLDTAVDSALRSAPWHTIRAYLQYTVAMTYAHAMPNASALLAPLRAARSGAAPPSIEAECLSSAAAAFPDLLGHYYVRRYFPETSKQAAERIVAAVMNAMGERLAANEWMDVTTRTHALAKLAAIRPMIGYPDTWSPVLPDFYVTVDDHLWNVAAQQTAAVAGNWAAINLPTLPAAPAWEMPVFQVNAYYDPLENDIVFPAGILQGGFFNEAAPLAANYGGIGMVIGHEVSHGFDDEGRRYDADGTRRDWWTPAAAEAFDERAQCVVDLYSSFSTPYGRVDGALTEGENLADLGGLVVSYRAYHDTLDDPATWAAPSRFASRDHYERHVLDTYGYSADQLFFRAWGASWCTQRSPQRATELLHQDPHSPPRWRINGPASQSTDFAAAFGCPAPPADACTMW